LFTDCVLLALNQIKAFNFSQRMKFFTYSHWVLKVAKIHVNIFHFLIDFFAKVSILVVRIF